MNLHEVGNELIPDWAVRRSDGSLELGAHLPTKDGRIMGNAHIIKIEKKQFSDREHIVYTILTDAGNEFPLSEPELRHIFHAPEWVANVNEVIEKFGRNT